MHGLLTLEERKTRSINLDENKRKVAKLVPDYGQKNSVL